MGREVVPQDCKRSVTMASLLKLVLLLGVTVAASEWQQGQKEAKSFVKRGWGRPRFRTSWIRRTQELAREAAGKIGLVKTTPKPTPPRPVWSEWGDWDDCSFTCGRGGTQVRTRKCQHGQRSDCPGSWTQKRACVMPPCPVSTTPSSGYVFKFPAFVQLAAEMIGEDTCDGENCVLGVDVMKLTDMILDGAAGTYKSIISMEKQEEKIISLNLHLEQPDLLDKVRRTKDNAARAMRSVMSSILTLVRLEAKLDEDEVPGLLQEASERIPAPMKAVALKLKEIMNPSIRDATTADLQRHYKELSERKAAVSN